MHQPADGDDAFPMLGCGKSRLMALGALGKEAHRIIGSGAVRTRSLGAGIGETLHGMQCGKVQR